MSNVNSVLTIIAMIFVVGNFVVSGLMRLFAKEYSTFIVLVVIGALMLVLGIIYHQYLASALLWFLIFSQLISILNEILHSTVVSKLVKSKIENQEEKLAEENKSEEKSE